jgi:hypothetical protein
MRTGMMQGKRGQYAGGVHVSVFRSSSPSARKLESEVMPHAALSFLVQALTSPSKLSQHSTAILTPAHTPRDPPRNSPCAARRSDAQVDGDTTCPQPQSCVALACKQAG